MSAFVIRGGRKLSGEIEVSGAKNAVLPILAASVMTHGENMLIDCPEISDVDSMLRILKALGCRAECQGGDICIDASGLTGCSVPQELMREMRSSVFLAGSLLSRCGEAVIGYPGGCNIGKRPIDIHIDGLKKLGVSVREEAEAIRLKAEKLKGAHIVLDFPSVGATENIMMAAVAAEGKTVIENSAKEPEICDLQEYINKCGGNISGAGTGRIEITGQGQCPVRLAGCCHRIMKDRIEGGTYLIMAAATGGDVCIRNFSSENITSLTDILREAGFHIENSGGNLQLKTRRNVKAARRICTAPYPGFPTDLQPQITAMLTRTGEGSVVEENIFEKRTGFAKQLIKIGADIEISQKKVIIKSNKILYGGTVEAEDLRGGAALVIAGLMAEGTVTVTNTKYIDRGYGRMEEKIRALGGDIIRYEEK